MRSYGSSANELSCPSGSALFRRSLLDASERLVSFSRFRQHQSILHRIFPLLFSLIARWIQRGGYTIFPAIFCHISTEKGFDPVD